MLGISNLTSKLYSDHQIDNILENLMEAFKNVCRKLTKKLKNGRRRWGRGNEERRGTKNKNNLIWTSSVLFSSVVVVGFQKTAEVSDNKLNQLFEEYKDPDDDLILAEGIERLCHDLNYQPDEFAILVLAWCLNASQMCRFTRPEFIEGLQKIKADTIPLIRRRLEEIIEVLNEDAELFKQLYRFTFRWVEYLQFYFLNFYWIYWNYLHRLFDVLIFYIFLWFVLLLQIRFGTGTTYSLTGHGHLPVASGLHRANAEEPDRQLATFPRTASHYSWYSKGYVEHVLEFLRAMWYR